tara:strand:- start:2507 stop:3337 length:831 start_codon:yes stop_codon:yes gene_type:complete
MLSKKIIICSTIKDEEKNLKNLFYKIDQITSQFEDYFLIFVESDSTDKSIVLLKEYISKRKGKIVIKKLKHKSNRIVRIEICRNQYLQYIKNNKKLNKFDYLLIMDADGVNNRINYKNLKNSIQKKNWNAIFANQSFFYYDVYALRIKNFINENFTYRIKQDVKNKPTLNLKNNIYKNLTKFFYLNKKFNQRYISVKSAFGGFGIYKLNKILEFKYNSFSGRQCEHVKLNEDIYNKYGGLYIDKNLINSYGINKHTINGYLCSKLNFFAKRFVSKI